RGLTAASFGGFWGRGRAIGVVWGFFTLRQRAAGGWGPSAPGCRGGGAAPAADSINNTVSLYVLTGNGIWDGTTAFGDSVLKLNTSGGLSLADWFTPYNQLSLDGNDTDVGSGGAAVLIDNGGAHPNLLIGGGKQGGLYVLDRTNLRKNPPSVNNHIVQNLAPTARPFGRTHCFILVRAPAERPTLWT